MTNLTHLSLFTGIGGIDLAAEWAGFETVGQVEKNEYCQKVLTKHWPDVPGWSDVHDVTRESFRERTGIDRPTIISGGFPCQPFSQAGKQEGQEDDRDLWPAMFGVIREIRPDWVLGENVAGFKGLGLDRTLSNLEAEGYSCRTFAIPAVAVEAQHKRERVFVVANTPESRCESEKIKNELFQSFTQRKRRLTNPRDIRTIDGVSTTLDRNRIESLGNSVVPQQVYPILKGIAEIEKAVRT